MYTKSGLSAPMKSGMAEYFMEYAGYVYSVHLCSCFQSMNGI